MERFVFYLVENNFADAPSEINKEHLEGSVEYWVNEGNIRYYNSLSNHLESIKAFYNFLIWKGKVRENIVPAVNYAEYKRYLADKFKLKDGAEREWLENEDIKNILDKLDAYFEITDYYSLKKQESDRYVYRMALRIYLKICLIAPAKKNVLYNLKLKDFQNEFRSVNVNGINILIPNGLRYNIIHTLKFIKETFQCIPDKNDYIFPFINERAGTRDSQGKGTKLNSCLAYFLKEYDFLDISTNVILLL